MGQKVLRSLASLIPTGHRTAAAPDVTIHEIADTIAHVVGYEGATDWDTSKPDGTPQKLLNVSLLRNAGCTSRITHEEGLSRTVDWYREHRDQLRD